MPKYAIIPPDKHTEEETSTLSSYLGLKSLLDSTSSGGICFGEKAQQRFNAENCRIESAARDPSPDLDDLQKEFEALKAERKSKEEQRSCNGNNKQGKKKHRNKSSSSLPDNFNGGEEEIPQILRRSATSEIKANSSTASSKRVSFQEEVSLVEIAEEENNFHYKELTNSDFGEEIEEEVEEVKEEIVVKESPIVIHVTSPEKEVEEEEQEVEEDRKEEDNINCGEIVEEDEELEERKEKSRNLSLKIDQILTEMAENEAAESASDLPPPPKKSQKPSEPPVTFREFDHVNDFEDLVRTIVTLVDQEEQDKLREMEDWIVKNEGTWVLSEGFNVFLGRVLRDQNLPSEGRVSMLKLLAYGAGQDDIVLIMHSDRKDHAIMNYAQNFDRLPIREQEACALFVST